MNTRLPQSSKGKAKAKPKIRYLTLPKESYFFVGGRIWDSGGSPPKIKLLKKKILIIRQPF